MSAPTSSPTAPAPDGSTAGRPDSVPAHRRTPPEPPGQSDAAPAPGFGLRGPRAERHVLAAERPGALSLPGRRRRCGPRRRPGGSARRAGHCSAPPRYDVVLVGGMWIAQVIALRAAATGARVAVETARPQAWAPMAQAAGGGQQCVTVHEVGRIAPQGASVASPVLVLRDCGARPPRSRLSAAPWQSVLTLLPFLGPNAARLLARADLVGLQRISPQEAEMVARSAAYPPGDAAALPTLGDNVTLWCTRTHRQFVMTQPTEAETGLLGGASPDGLTGGLWRQGGGPSHES